MGRPYAPEEDRALRKWDTADPDARPTLLELSIQVGRSRRSVEARVKYLRWLIQGGVSPDGPFRQKRGARNLYHVAGLHEGPDPEAIRKRDELDRMLLTTPLTFGQRFFGDPLPTRSAPERRGQEMRT